MAFFKRNGGAVRDQDQNKVQRVYVIKLILDDGTIIHKVGKASGRSSKERLLQILGSFFDKYRYIPRSSIRLDMSTPVAFLVEKHMHTLLAEYQYTRLDSKVSGYTEMFTDIDEDVLLDYMRNFPYNELLQVKKMKIEDYEAICSILNDKVRVKQKGTDTIPF